MKRAGRWIVRHRFEIAWSSASAALATMHEFSWLYTALIGILAAGCYADGMEQGIRRATGRRPEGGAS